MPKDYKPSNAFVNAVKAKGGMKYFDLGGPTSPAPLAQPTTVSAPNQPGTPTSGVTNPGSSAFNSAVGATNNFEAPLNQGIQGVANNVGGVFQGIGTAFTPQNQYQASLAPTSNLDYSGVIGNSAGQSQAGYGQLQSNIGNEQNLEQQLINQGNGQGPNPALAQLNQTTGQNVQNQAALAAGQRGASSNAGLIARQAGQQGAATQQASVGQAATLGAQQQLAAQQGAAALQGQIGNQVTNEQQVNNQLFSGATGANNAQNANLVTNYGNAQGINANVAQNNTNSVAQSTGGLLGGASSLLALLAHGGEVKHFDSGGMAQATLGTDSETPAAPIVTGTPSASTGSGPISWVGKFLNGTASNIGQPSSTPAATPAAATALPSSTASQVNVGQGFEQAGKNLAGSGGIQSLFSSLAKGGKVPAMVSPGEVYLPPSKVKEVASKGANPIKAGEHISGKAKVKGDSLKNDIVPKALDEGGIVIPRHITQGKDAPKKALAFVQAIQAKQGLKRK